MWIDFQHAHPQAFAERQQVSRQLLRTLRLAAAGSAVAGWALYQDYESSLSLFRAQKACALSTARERAAEAEATVAPGAAFGGGAAAAAAAAAELGGSVAAAAAELGDSVAAAAARDAEGGSAAGCKRERAAEP